MPEDKTRSPSVSRRALLAVAASTPAATAMPVTTCSPPGDALPARCSEWLAVDFEIDRLSLRWSVLETQAAREFDLFKLSSAKRRALPMSAEMEEIDERLEDLFRARTKGLKALRRMKPADVHGAVSKLVVAARASQYEGGDIHAFVVEAIDVLANLKCPVCGAPYAPATLRRA